MGRKPIGSYLEEDCIFLLKEVGDLVKEVDTRERERNMQQGRHYSELLPSECLPKPSYVELYRRILVDTADEVAYYIAVLSELIYKKKGKNVILVSLARAGTPIGVLIKRYLNKTYGINPPHYSVSIIRDKGIDENALLYILDKHPEGDLQFIDGWTGKGVISDTLVASCNSFKIKYSISLDSTLAVVCDPGQCTNLYATRKDFLIPSACLNATVSGLISRTFLREDVISKKDFHGAKYYKEWEDSDLSNEFVDCISAHFEDIRIKPQDLILDEGKGEYTARKSIETIQQKFKIDSINRIKPGIGETTRVLLRRMPSKILIKSPNDSNLKHILVLAEEKQVPVEVYSEMCYACCGLIKSIK